MCNGVKRVFLRSAVLVAAFASMSAASVIEPWRNDISPAATPRSEHSFGASVLLADGYIETPFKIFYGISDNAELATRWGAIFADGQAGISDLKFAVKYNLTKIAGDVPAIFIEGGVSLPTADHTRGLGAGGVGLSAGWNIIKEMKPLRVFAALAGEFNDNDVLAGARPPRVFSFKAGARYDYKKDIVLTGELKGFNNYRRNPDAFKQELYLSPGVHYSGSFPFSAAVLLGMSGDSRRFAIYLEKNF
ncbi:MAG: hypothetical protein CVU77_01160 [Elusimicrobia bacterium HGW-Elusimicrobia-1]|jgi:hypothetical protein|nr:MAG: hypothetical protein CVU77_01160 [Elusimicrobia bacterium HGW-Elusimicrobia-1]